MPWKAKRNPPAKIWENICQMCGKRWPKADMHTQRSAQVCGRKTCLDEPDPKQSERY